MNVLLTPGQVSPRVPCGGSHSAGPDGRMSGRVGAELTIKARHLGRTAIPFWALSFKAAQMQAFPAPLPPTE